MLKHSLSVMLALAFAGGASFAAPGDRGGILKNG